MSPDSISGPPRYNCDTKAPRTELWKRVNRRARFRGLSGATSRQTRRLDMILNVRLTWARDSRCWLLLSQQVAAHKKLADRSRMPAENNRLRLVKFLRRCDTTIVTSRLKRVLRWEFKVKNLRGKTGLGRMWSCVKFDVVYYRVVSLCRGRYCWASAVEVDAQRRVEMIFEHLLVGYRKFTFAKESLSLCECLFLQTRLIFKHCLSQCVGVRIYICIMSPDDDEDK